MIIKQCEQDKINVMFIESVLEDDAIEEATIRVSGEGRGAGWGQLYVQVGVREGDGWGQLYG